MILAAVTVKENIEILISFLFREYRAGGSNSLFSTSYRTIALLGLGFWPPQQSKLLQLVIDPIGSTFYQSNILSLKVMLYF